MNTVEDEVVYDEVLLDTSLLDGKRTHSKSTKSEERRRHFRKPAKWRSVGFLSDGRSFDALLEDISESGVLMKVGRPATIGQRAYIKMHSFVGGERKVLDAVVVFRHVSLCGDIYRAGCEFVHMSDEVKSFIADYVRGGCAKMEDASTMLGRPL